MNIDRFIDGMSSIVNGQAVERPAAWNGWMQDGIRVTGDEYNAGRQLAERIGGKDVMFCPLHNGNNIEKNGIIVRPWNDNIDVLYKVTNG